MMDDLQAQEALRAELRQLNMLIGCVLRDGADEQTDAIARAVAEATEYYQSSPSEAAAWRDGLASLLRFVWRQTYPGSWRTLAATLVATWIAAAQAAAAQGAPPAAPEVRHIIAELERAAEIEVDEDLLKEPKPGARGLPPRARTGVWRQS